MSDDLDPLHTIDDWYDGPLAGATEYRGRPHFYRSLCLAGETWEAEEGRFALVPLTPDVLAGILEAARLHQRWVDAQRAGTLPPEPDPDDLRVLAPDRDRWLTLARERDAYLASVRDQTVILRGEFRPGAARVRWSVPAAE